MRHILRRHELVVDEWRYAGEEPSDAEGIALIVPMTRWRGERERWQMHRGRLGVRLTPSDAVEDLSDDLPRLGLVAVEFPTPGEGRGYSQGRLLRERLAFGGELRAAGAAVRQDQVFLLARCGFDAIELAPGEDPRAALHALGRYDVAYQPGATLAALRQQRFLGRGA